MKTLMCLLLFINLSYSQLIPGLGIKVGISYPNLIVDNNSSNKIKISNKIGFNGGIFIDLLFKDFGLTSELYYNQKYVNVIVNSIEMDYKIDYLTYNVFLKLNYSNKLISPYFFTGPGFAIYLNDGAKRSTELISKGTSIEITDNIKKLVFSYGIGAGIMFRISNGRGLILESLFNPAIMDIYKDPNVSAKSNSIEFKIGYGF